MLHPSKSALAKTIEMIRAGGVGVMPTDTIYGIVGSAFKETTVARIYRLRQRNLKKPMIILIGEVTDLRLFDISMNANLLKMLRKFWPGKVSIILNCHERRGKKNEFHYLHRGGKTLAFRLPKPLWLRQLLQKTGPLVAPSANFEGEPPAKTIRKAKKYFGKNVDFYLDVGLLNSPPSTILRIEKGKVIVLRKGAR